MITAFACMHFHNQLRSSEPHALQQHDCPSPDRSARQLLLLLQATSLPSPHGQQPGDDIDMAVVPCSCQGHPALPTLAVEDDRAKPLPEQQLQCWLVVDAVAVGATSAAATPPPVPFIKNHPCWYCSCCLHKHCFVLHQLYQDPLPSREPGTLRRLGWTHLRSQSTV